MRAIWLVIGILLIIIGIPVAIFLPWMFPQKTTMYSFGGYSYTMETPNMSLMYIGVAMAGIGGLLITVWIISYSMKKGKEVIKEAIREARKEE